MSGYDLREADIRDFALDFGGNLLRWQLLRGKADTSTPELYRAWLDAELDNCSSLLMRAASCRKVSVRATNASVATVNAAEAVDVTARGRSEVSCFAPGADTSFDCDDFSRVSLRETSE